MSAPTMGSPACTWHTTGKFVCPVRPGAPTESASARVTGDATMEGAGEPKAFGACARGVQDQVALALFGQWERRFVENGIVGGASVRDLFLRGEASNPLFVFFDSQGAWSSTVAIDASAPLPTISAPCINHLYVRKAFRLKGAGRAALAWAERRVAASGHSLAALWCTPALERFYSTSGWSRVSRVSTSNFAEQHGRGDQSAALIIMGKHVSEGGSA
jgi:GNAT superfamily N-acetyltransferase